MSFNRVGAVIAVSGALVGAMGLSGCQSAGKALGMSKVTPDEFRVVTKAPLVVPPDFSLRPPAPGEPRPQELQPESAAREALLGERNTVQRDDAEKALVAKAGGESADPLIRYVVDDEFGDIAHKDRNFADKVMFWRKDRPNAPVAAPSAAAAGATAPAPVDPAAEQARLKSLTGGQQVVIQQAPSGNRIKLPGL
jgi:hypothetical protein